jgi:hypothetical protein
MAIYGPNGILSRGAWQASKRLWAYVAEQITSRPKWCAEQTGIEKLGYLIDLKPPEKLPELDELEKVWKENAKCSTAQMKKVLRCWGDFRKRSAIKGLRDITPESHNQAFNPEAPRPGLHRRLIASRGSPKCSGLFQTAISPFRQ